MKKERSSSTLLPARLERIYVNEDTGLDDLILGEKHYGGVSLADVLWEGTNLAVVRWSEVPFLGDEYTARQPRIQQGQGKSPA